MPGRQRQVLVSKLLPILEGSGDLQLRGNSIMLGSKGCRPLPENICLGCRSTRVAKRQAVGFHLHARLLRIRIIFANCQVKNEVRFARVLYRSFSVHALSSRFGHSARTNVPMICLLLVELSRAWSNEKVRLSVTNELGLSRRVELR